MIIENQNERTTANGGCSMDMTEGDHVVRQEEAILRVDYEAYQRQPRSELL